MARHFRNFLKFAALAAVLLAGCATAVPPSVEAAHTLAPNETLRVGLYPGSPTSIIEDPKGAKGLGYDLGKELAKRLGVSFVPVVFPKNADLLAALKAGKVDLSFTNASPQRQKEMDFSATVLEAEKGYLVAGASPIHELVEVDQPSMRIGVSQGSTTESELRGELKQALMVRVATLDDATQMLSSGQLDVFATNKAILFELSDRLPGARVLDGRWGLEHFAFAIPKGRDPALAYLNQLVADLQAEGLVNQAVARVGLRGTLSTGAGSSP